MCEERTFTWFPKLTRVMETLPPENVAEFAMAVAEYGTNAVEPAFASPLLAAVFEGVREDIDNSINARHRNKGGRPKKNPRENGGSEVSETQETPVSQNENQFSETETPVTENGNRSEEVSENENPSYINHTKPYQTIPSQTKERGKRTRFHPPSVDEVAAYCSEKGYDVDPERFVAFYESKGWKVGKNPMKSWTAACVTWHKRHQDEANRQGVTDSELDFYANRSQDEIIC